jgi:hypothetical protein
MWQNCPQAYYQPKCLTWWVLSSTGTCSRTGSLYRPCCDRLSQGVGGCQFQGGKTVLMQGKLTGTKIIFKVCICQCCNNLPMNLGFVHAVLLYHVSLWDYSCIMWWQLTARGRRKEIEWGQDPSSHTQTYGNNNVHWKELCWSYQGSGYLEICPWHIHSRSPRG